MMNKSQKSVVVLGGGTGTFSVLQGLKEYTDRITAIVNMVDSGGSAKKERDEWGLLPSSDIRKSLLALADVSKQDSLLLRNLFQYRYDQGVGVSGMTFGNLFLVALTKLMGSQEKAIEKAGKLLQIKGTVLPVTLQTADLVAEYEDGTRVIGEHFIDEPKHNGAVKIKKIETKPNVSITQNARKAIEDADVILIGPGGFYTTILATLVVDGVVEALKKSKAKKVFILNLMTEFGQTYQFTAADFMRKLDGYVPLSLLDYVVINNTPIPPSILKRYKKFHALPVVNDLNQSFPFQVVAVDVLSSTFIPKQKGDTLNRSLVRHDPQKIANICKNLLHLL